MPLALHLRCIDKRRLKTLLSLTVSLRIVPTLKLDHKGAQYLLLQYELNSKEFILSLHLLKLRIK